MKRLNQSYKINGRTIEATATKDGDVLYNLNIILDRHDAMLQVNILDKKLDPDTHFHSFLTYFLAVELHEIGHVYNWKVGCNHKKYPPNSCLWCLEVEKIYKWLL